jgi:hypothetical protein
MGNRITFYSGRMFHSRLEANYARELDLRRHLPRAEERVIQWDGQVSIPLRVNGVLVCRYVADFRVYFADGRVELHEVKGFETETWRLKEKLFRALHPDLILRVIGPRSASTVRNVPATRVR